MHHAVVRVHVVEYPLARRQRLELWGHKRDDNVGARASVCVSNRWRIDSTSARNYRLCSLKAFVDNVTLALPCRQLYPRKRMMRVGDYVWLLGSASSAHNRDDDDDEQDDEQQGRKTDSQVFRHASNRVITVAPTSVDVVVVVIVGCGCGVDDSKGLDLRCDNVIIFLM